MTDATYSTLAVSQSAGVGQLVLDGHGPQNTLDLETATELAAAVDELVTDDAVRCLSITGAGETFCAGANLGAFDGDAANAPVIRELAATFHEAVDRLYHAETPVVTGVRGVAAGAGFSLALAGDLVLLSEAAVLNYAYPRVGLTGDGGATFLLPRLVGLRRAKEILLLDESVDVDRAVDIGLATEVVSPARFEARLDELATTVAQGPTRAYGLARRLMVESFERGFTTQLAAETAAIAAAAETEDFARGRAAFFEKESPEFIGR